MSLKLEHSAVNGYLCPDDPMGRLSVNDQEAKLIAALVGGLFVLEIGTGLGVSTRALADEAVVLISVDNDPWCQRHVWKEILSQYDNVIFKNAIPSSGNFEAVFIDGDHSTQAVIKDIQESSKVAAPDCIYIFHDTKIGTVAEAINQCFQNWIDCQTKAGIGIAWLSDRKE